LRAACLPALSSIYQIQKIKLGKSGNKLFEASVSSFQTSGSNQSNVFWCVCVVFFFWKQVSYVHSAALAGFEFKILVPHPPQCWDDRAQL
jgi:hypothetical protein